MAGRGIDGGVAWVDETEGGVSRGGTAAAPAKPHELPERGYHIDPRTPMPAPTAELAFAAAVVVSP
jgi:hypothetical protein